MKPQLLYGVLPGIFLFFLGAGIYYGRYARFALWMLLAGILLLVLVFTPLGVHANGATRWLKIGSIIFQPAEFIKPLFIIYLASWLSRRKERYENFKTGLLPFLAILGVIGILLLKQPSTSTIAILVAVASLVYFSSGARLRFVMGTIAAAGIVIALAGYVTP